MRLLDLFCGAGGMACGYVRAGFTVTGVDHVPQPNYLRSGASAFVLADAIQYAADHGHEYDAVHASPPCQAYSSMARFDGSDAPKLIDWVRWLLGWIAVPYVIENVEGAPLRGHVVTLCGTMLGLRVRRHRLFEFSDDLPLLLTPGCQCRHGVRDGRLVGHRLSRSVGPGRTVARLYTPNELKEAMGVPWMTQRECRQAIPPAYAEYVGRHLHAHLACRAERPPPNPSRRPDATPGAPSHARALTKRGDFS